MEASIDCWPWWLETIRTKGLPDKQVITASRQRPGPRFIQQFGQLNLAAPKPWIIDPRNHDQWLFVQDLRGNRGYPKRRLRKDEPRANHPCCDGTKSARLAQRDVHRGWDGRLAAQSIVFREGQMKRRDFN